MRCRFEFGYIAGLPLEQAEAARRRGRSLRVGRAVFWKRGASRCVVAVLLLHGVRARKCIMLVAHFCWGIRLCLTAWNRQFYSGARAI